MEELGASENFYLNFAGGPHRRAAAAVFYDTHFPDELPRTNRAEKDGVTIDFPYYLDEAAEEAKHAVRKFSLAEEDLPLGKVRARHYRPSNWQHGPNPCKLARLFNTWKPDLRLKGKGRGPPRSPGNYGRNDVDFFPIVFSTVDGNGRSKVQTMTAQLRNDSQALLHLVTVGAVAAATITVFFGIGFLWLAPPHPVTAPTDPAAPAQVLNAREVPSLSNNDTTLGSSAAPPADNVAVNPTATAPSNPRVLALTSTAPETPIIARVGRTHAKRVRVGRHGHGQTARGWLLGWRSDASAGPNPGGGFYGPPNFNVGYINPK